MENEQASNEVPTAKLWNPTAAAVLSLFTIPAFGAAIHYMNWKALGKNEEAQKTKAWILGGIIVFCFNTTVGVVAADKYLWIFVVDSLLYWFAWFASLGSDQIRFVKMTYGKVYPKKGVILPFVLTAAVAFAWVFWVSSFLPDGKSQDKSITTSVNVAAPSPTSTTVLDVTDLQVEFAKYVGKQINVQGVLVSVAGQVMMIQSLGNTGTMVSVNISRLPVTVQKSILGNCGQGACGGTVSGIPVVSDGQNVFVATSVVNK